MRRWLASVSVILALVAGAFAFPSARPVTAGAAAGSPTAQRPYGLKVPAGFTVSEYADSKLANDIYCMTVDPAGRIVVAGRGYIRVLVDDDGDGKADRAIDLIDGLKDGPMGLLAEGDSLFVVSDGGRVLFTTATGLWAALVL